MVAVHGELTVSVVASQEARELLSGADERLFRDRIQHRETWFPNHLPPRSTSELRPELLSKKGYSRIQLTEHTLPPNRVGKELPRSVIHTIYKTICQVK